MNAHTLPDTLAIRPSVLYFGTPVVLITTCNDDGSANITPMSSAWALADRVVVGLSGGSQGLANLLRERCCVLNLAGEAMQSAVERLAPTTGRFPVPDWKREAGYRHAPDKFTLAGLHPLRSVEVAPPRIAESPLQLEARVTDSWHRPLEAWREDAGGFAILDLKVVRVHAHADLIVPGTQHIDPARYAPLFYLFRHYVARGATLGRTFKAEV